MKHRTEQLNIRVTPQEKAALASAARARGFSGVADYLRAAALGGKPPQEHVYTVIIHPADADEGGFWAEVPALPGCNTQGNTYEQTVAHAHDAIKGYLQMLLKTGQPIPTERQPRKSTVATVKVAV